MDIREALVHGSGCPLCTIGEEGVDRFIRWFKLEYYHESQMLIDLGRGGFCREHAGRMAGLDNVLAYPYEYVTRSRIKFLENWEAERDRRGKPKTAGPVCPCCRAYDVAVNCEAGELVNLLQGEDGRATYRKGATLCWRHFLAVFREAQRETARFLVQDYLERLRRLEKEFASYFEQLGPGKESRDDPTKPWLTALRLFTSDRM